MVELDETCVWIAIFRVRLAAAFVTRMERGLSEVDAPCPMSSPPPSPTSDPFFIAKLHERFRVPG